MSYEVSVRVVEPGPIAVVRERMESTDLSRQIIRLFDRLYSAVRDGTVRGGGLNVVVYRGRSGGGVDLEVGIQVSEPFPDVGDVVCSETPGGTVATTVHWGPYETLREAYDAVQSWCHENGRPKSRVSWEIYGHWDDDPAKRRTDVVHLLHTAEP